MLRLLLDTLESPAGTIWIASDGEALRALFFDDGPERITAVLRKAYGEIELVRSEDPGGASSILRAYFDGDLTAVDTLPVAAAGTPFQQDVWKALREIPPGTTATYGEIARRVGRPDAVRATGAANGANPISIVVPCHRVIGSNGKLTGYGGGLDRKQWLLRHEQACGFQLVP